MITLPIATAMTGMLDRGLARRARPDAQLLESTPYWS